MMGPHPQHQALLDIIGMQLAGRHPGNQWNGNEWYGGIMGYWGDLGGSKGNTSGFYAS
jgi:hypothetical protein